MPREPGASPRYLGATGAFVSSGSEAVSFAEEPDGLRRPSGERISFRDGMLRCFSVGRDELGRRPAEIPKKEERCLQSQEKVWYNTDVCMRGGPLPIGHERR